MTKYKCGHEPDSIFVNPSMVGMNYYVDWKNTTGFNGDESECFACYLERIKNEPLGRKNDA